MLQSEPRGPMHPPSALDSASDPVPKNQACGAAGFSAFLALTLAGFFPGVLIGARTFFYRDFGVLAYPTLVHARASFWRGEFPLWNPLSNCGEPFLAQWGTMVLYPFSLLYLVFPIPWSVNLFCLLHLFWAGLGMYRLAWRWTENRLGAAVAGAGFVYNGVTFSCLMWPNYCAALSWMPWVVLAVEWAWNKGSKRPLALAALVAGLQLLCGVPEIVLLTWFLLLGLATVRFSFGKAGGDLVFRSLMIVALAAGVASAQLLPFFDLLAHSQRDATTAVKWAMPLSSLGNFLVPMFRCGHSSQGLFFQLGQDFFGSTYLGIIELFLALFACGRARARQVPMLGALSLFCLVLALGDNGLLYQAIRALFPGLGFMRYPVKFMILPAFSVPVLAAYGAAKIDRGLAGNGRNQRAGWVVMGALFLGLALVVGYSRAYPSVYESWSLVWASAAWRAALLAGGGAALLVPALRSWLTRHGWVEYAVLLVLVVDAWVLVPRTNPTLPSSVMAPGLWELETKTAPPRFGEGRVLISPYAEDHLLVSSVTNPESDFLGKRLALWSNLNLLEQIPKVNGSSTLQIREEKQLESILYGSTNAAFAGLDRFLNVTFKTAPGRIIEWSRQAGSLPLITGGQQPLFATPSESLPALTNAAFDPGQVVFLPAEAKTAGASTRSGKVSISNARFDAHQIDCATRSPSGGWIVVAQTYYHRWRAYVDGKPTALWRANYAFQALQVPSGHHVVRLRYTDSAFRTGLVLSFLSLLGLGALWLTERSRRRTSSADPSPRQQES
jgi:hypothetical protein